MTTDESLCRDLGFTEGPVWNNEGVVVFTSIAGAIFRYELESGELTRTEAGCGPTGLVQAADGEIYVAASSGLGRRASPPAAAVTAIAPARSTALPIPQS